MNGETDFFVAAASVVEDPSGSSTASPSANNNIQADFESDPNSSVHSPETKSSDKLDNGVDDSTSIASLLKKTGGFRGCIRNLVINDRAYRFGLEPAGDSLQGFDIGKSHFLSP